MKRKLWFAFTVLVLLGLGAVLRGPMAQVVEWVRFSAADPVVGDIPHCSKAFASTQPCVVEGTVEVDETLLSRYLTFDVDVHTNGTPHSSDALRLDVETAVSNAWAVDERANDQGCLVHRTEFVFDYPRMGSSGHVHRFTFMCPTRGSSGFEEQLRGTMEELFRDLLEGPGRQNHPGVPLCPPGYELEQPTHPQPGNGVRWNVPMIVPRSPVPWQQDV